MIQFVVTIHVQGFILEAGCPPLRVATIHTRNTCTCKKFELVQVSKAVILLIFNP